jgi:hypothetical protein
VTKNEINKFFDIPVSTLNEWQKTTSTKNKLYTFLLKSDSKDISNITNSHKTHRLFHILNRNIDKNKHYSYDEIQTAFTKNNYDEATSREQLIYSKFFKECESEELDSLSVVFGINKRNIKKLYVNAPERLLGGVAKIWDKRFRLKHISKITQIVSSTPTALQFILNKRALNV